MTTYGLENGGGRQFGKNPNSSSAEGIFQFTKDLRDTYKLSDQDIYDPEKMIHWAAYNMRRNADILKLNTRSSYHSHLKLYRLFYALHQWGERCRTACCSCILAEP